MSLDPEESLDQSLEACGKALGFVIAMAAAERESLGKRQGALSFAQTVSDMCDVDRFSPNVTLVLLAMTDGVRAAAEAGAGRRDGQEII